MKRLLLSSFVLFAIILSTSAQVQTAGSYLNISRPAGGPIQKGDIIEVRAVMSVPSGTTVTAIRFTDNIPAGTSYVTNSIKAVTAEGVVAAGVTNTGNYTDAAGDDRAQHISGAITVYLGDGATSAVGGSLNGTTSFPRCYNAACILMVAYRVKVTVYNGSSITFGGAFRYTNGTVQNITLPSNVLRVALLGGCSSPSGVNRITEESAGTFGSGSAHSRSASTQVTGFTYQNLGVGNPDDGQYSITKNTSPTQYTAGTPATTDRTFGVWDIIGDHSGTSTAAGNSAAANGLNRGYMAVVNASYAPAAVFNVPITGLATNSGYTLSFWIRNICGTCGNDPISNASSGTPGIKPNLAFEMDGSDLYSTGEIAYTGQWVKKTFTFYSGSATSFTMAIKNNAPGGGGNDWAIDDIVVQQCYIVLPVKMSLFVATPKGNDVVLNWETAEEINLSYFSVERSRDGINFEGIGNVSRHSGSNKYQFIDHDKSAGKSFYRLQIVDSDDRTTTTKTLLVSGITGKNEVMVVPNPVKTDAVLNIESTSKGLAEIQVYNAQGKLMLKQHNNVVNGANQVMLDRISELPNGIYMIQVAIDGNRMVTRMIVSK